MKRRKKNSYFDNLILCIIISYLTRAPMNVIRRLFLNPQTSTFIGIKLWNIYEKKKVSKIFIFWLSNFLLSSNEIVYRWLNSQRTARTYQRLQTISSSTFLPTYQNIYLLVGRKVKEESNRKIKERPLTTSQE